MNENLSLQKKHCSSSKEVIFLLDQSKIASLLNQLNPEWKVLEGKQIERAFSFPNFSQALDFTNVVGALAEEEDHHPDIHLSWGKVKVVL